MPKAIDQNTPAPQTATPKPNAVVLRSPTAVAEFLSGDWPDTATTKQEAIIGILDQVLSAETAEEILADTSKATSWRDMVGVPYELTGGIRLLDSDTKFIDDKTIVPKFAVVQAVNMTTGEQTVLTSGAFKVVAQVKRLFERGILAGQRVTIQEKETRDGFKAYALVSVPDVKPDPTDADV